MKRQRLLAVLAVSGAVAILCGIGVYWEIDRIAERPAAMPERPVLGTADVCSLFDGTLLDRAVPDPTGRSSELDLSGHPKGNSGHCAVDSSAGSLRIDVEVVLEVGAGLDPAETRASRELDSYCRDVLAGAVVRPATRSADGSCSREDGAADAVTAVHFGARKGTRLFRTEYRFGRPVAGDAARTAVRLIEDITAGSTAPSPR
ncbi:hypothetical protein ACQP00_24875 [Dactylosporangium sp. CS-047395]|uniref:hypothetical protein n=1 Tax=Dactylosporangium sp. CS-047395 TaxID=3239936 RepID=UPI003D8AECD9